MSLDPWVLAAIVAMSLATFGTRAGGYLIFKAFRPSPIVRDLLGYIPGALFVSYVLPGLAAGGTKEWVGAAVTLGLMVTTRQLAIAVLGGTAAAWAVWGVL